MKTLQLCRESIKKKLSVLEAFAPGELSQEVFANLSEQVASEIGWNISEVLEQLGSAWLWSSRRGYDGNIRPWEAHLSFATSMASSRFVSLNRISTDIMVTRIDFSWICSHKGN